MTIPIWSSWLVRLVCLLPFRLLRSSLATRWRWTPLALSVYVHCFVFFFSSRRRHTRLQGDWSSDVCSSDLLLGTRCTNGSLHLLDLFRRWQDGRQTEALNGEFTAPALCVIEMMIFILLHPRMRFLERFTCLTSGHFRHHAQQLPICVVLGLRMHHTFASN